MLDDTTRSDLEDLLAEVDAGWAAYCGPTPEDAIVFGIGGCLIEEMTRLLNRKGAHGVDLFRRADAMVMALGFTRLVRDDSDDALVGCVLTRPNSPAMFFWNDEQTDPDVIKHRIKDALNGP